MTKTLRSSLQNNTHVIRVAAFFLLQRSMENIQEFLEHPVRLTRKLRQPVACNELKTLKENRFLKKNDLMLYTQLNLKLNTYFCYSYIGDETEH